MTNINPKNYLLIFLISILTLSVFPFPQCLYADDDHGKIILREISNGEFKLGDVILFSSQNIGKLNKLAEFFHENKKESGNPILEFKKINPAKYKVKVYKANSNFLIIFSETFHHEWKLIPIVKKNSLLQESADNEVLRSIDVGSKSLVPRESKKYISENIMGTIQNDNLKDATIYESWFSHFLPEDFHLVANGYANGWFIDLDYLRTNFENSLKVNKNGTIDFELLLLYTPQRLRYIGWGITLITFFICAIYSMVFFCQKIRSRK
jgi:hypothetical protein